MRLGAETELALQQQDTLFSGLSRQEHSASADAIAALTAVHSSMHGAFRYPLSCWVLTELQDH